MRYLGLILALLSAAVLNAQISSGKLEWKTRSEESFVLARGAHRVLWDVSRHRDYVPANWAFIRVHVESTLPVNIGLVPETFKPTTSTRQFVAQTIGCKYTNITKIEAVCTFPRDGKSYRLAVEDGDRQWLTGFDGYAVSNRVVISIDNVTCKNNCEMQF